MPVLRDHYYRLASELPKERIEAATALLSELQSEQSKEEWDYALNRLIKGLTSTRQSARIGFSMALIEVLSLLIKDPESPETVVGYLKQLMTLTEVKSSMKGKEERAVLFGRLFGLQAILNSGLLYDREVSPLDALQEFTSLLIQLSTLKSWIRESTIFTLCSFMSKMEGTQENEGLFVSIFQQLNDAGLNLTTEGVAVYLSVKSNNRSVYAQQVENLQPSWKNGDPFSKGNLPLLTKVLKDVEVVAAEQQDDEKKQQPKQKSSWNPRVHFVWDLVIRELVDRETSISEEVEESSKKRKKSSTSKSSKKSKLSNIQSLEDPAKLSIKEFWKVVIDESLFSEKSSHERKYWGFDIFIKFVSNVKEREDLEGLFTPNLIRCLINQSAQQSRFLNKISVQVLKTLVEVASANPDKAPTIFSCLINESHGGCWNFDLVTKSKCTDEILTKCTGESLEEVKNILIKKFKEAVKQAQVEEEKVNEEDEDEDQASDEEENEKKKEILKSSTDNIQKWSLDKLLMLIRANKAALKDGDSSWLEDIFKVLIENSFFKKSSRNVSVNIKNLSQERLNSILADVINFKTTKGEPWPLFCINYITELETDEDKFSLLESFDESLTSNKQETLEILAGIKKSIRKATKKNDENQVDQLFCFQLLFSMVLIQFYTADEEAVSVLDELKLCYDDIANSGESEVDTSQVLTEIILSFVARKSTLLKKLSMIIWESFLCSKGDDNNIRLNEESLKLLYDVLEARENKEGLEKIFEGQGEFEAVNEDGESEGDDEKEDDESEDEEDGEDEEDEEDDSSDEGEEDDSSNPIDKETSIKLAQALGIPTETSGEVKFSDLSSEGSSDESDMDDEQMMEIDGQLSKIFKERQDALSSVVSGSKRKEEVMEAKEQMIFFKNRILDLLESLNKHQPTSYLNLTMIKPLVVLIKLTLDKNVGLKAHKLLKTKISKTKVTQAQIEQTFTDEEEQNTFKESLVELIEWLQQQASNSSNQSHSMACNQACIIVAKNLIGIDESYLEKVIDIYTASLKEWASTKKSKIQASMFFDFINWLNSKR